MLNTIQALLALMRCGIRYSTDRICYDIERGDLQAIAKEQSFK